MRGPCVKQRTFCNIVTEEGRNFRGWNTCDIPRLEEGTACPRVAAGCPTGEGYELCQSLHAEANAAAAKKAAGDTTPGIAYLYGHDWLCGPCQHALQDVGVNHYVVTGRPA